MEKYSPCLPLRDFETQKILHRLSENEILLGKYQMIIEITGADISQNNARKQGPLGTE